MYCISKKSDCKLWPKDIPYHRKLLRAFTLIELLVVISIIALLMSILMPSLRKAQDLAKMVVCLSNERQIGLAFNIYTSEFDDLLPPCYTYPAPGGYAYFENAWGGKFSLWYHLVGKYMQATEKKQTYGGEIYGCPSVKEFGGGWLKPKRGERNTYGYNFRVLSGTSADQIWGHVRVKVNRIAKPAETVMVCEAGSVWQDKFINYEPAEWPPLSNNPGLGYVSFPGDVQWGKFSSLQTETAVPLAVHSGKVNGMFLDGHASAIAIDKLLDPQRGDGDCLYDAR